MPAIKECDGIMSGSFKRYAESQLLWNCSALAWGNYTSASRFFCKSGNIFETNIASLKPTYCLKIDNSKGYSYCSIELTGTIAAYTPGTAINTNSYIVLAALGILERGNIGNTAPFDKPPLAAIEYTNDKVAAFNACGLEVTTANESFGSYINNSYGITSTTWRPWITGFPWAAGVAPVTADPFMFVSHIGARQSGGIGSLGGPGSMGQLSIAGYKDLYVIVGFINPTFPGPPNNPVLTLTMSLYAHLYDKDVRT